ncbi:hypothetical protein AtEden1_Chr3g0193421 [Arabidopsis thaliana]
MDLGREEPELFIPYHAYAGALASNRLSLLGRILNPQTQIHGRILDERCFQVRFRSEVDLLNVLMRASWGFQDFPTEDFLTFIDLWVQIRGIPLPYVSKRTVEIIASTLGEVVAIDFNEATTSQLTFIRVKVRIDFTEPLRFFRRVRFESRERAMIGFDHCPYLVHHEEVDDEPDVMVSLERHDDEDSNSLNQRDQESNSQSSIISLFSSIYPTSLNDSPIVSWNGYAAGNLPQRFSSSSNSSSHTVSASYLAASDWRPVDRASYEFGERSKRKKGKQVLEEPERNIRQRQMGSGIRFYPVNGEAL